MEERKLAHHSVVQMSNSMPAYLRLCIEPSYTS